MPKYAYFGKERLAAYPNEDGVCVYVGKGQDEKACEETLVQDVGLRALGLRARKFQKHMGRHAFVALALAFSTFQTCGVLGLAPCHRRRRPQQNYSDTAGFLA